MTELASAQAVTASGPGSEPSGTKQDILDAATAEFADFGLSGGRVDAIAERTKTSKRMIYYHFGSKEGLYLAVLERAYRAIRTVEEQLNLGELSPAEAMRALIERTFDYDDANPDFIRLVSIENIHRGKHMAKSQDIAALNRPIIDNLRGILAKGQAAGVFRADVDAIDLHVLISSFCFFRVSNRHTLGLIFDRDLSEPTTRRRHRTLIGDVVLAYLTEQQPSVDPRLTGTN